MDSITIVSMFALSLAAGLGGVRTILGIVFSLMDQR